MLCLIPRGSLTRDITARIQQANASENYILSNDDIYSNTENITCKENMNKDALS